MDNFNKIEELLFEIAEKENISKYNEILDILKKSKLPVPQSTKDCINMIIESWQLNPDESGEKTSFLIELTQFFENDFPDLRSSMPAIIKKALPEGFNKSTSIKALGIRNEDVPLSEVYNRFLKLKALTENKIFFNTASSSWGKTGEIDWIAGTIVLSNLNNNEVHEINLDVALKQIFFFNITDELSTLIEKRGKISKNKAVGLLLGLSVSPILDDALRNCMFFTYIPDKMTPYEFENWWKNEKEEEDSKDSLEKARSIQELNQFLVSNKNKIEITDDMLKKIGNVLSLIKPGSKTKDFVLWAETTSLVLAHLKKGQMKQLTPESSIIEEIWPDIPEENYPGMGIWTNLKSASLSVWAEFTKQIKGEKYLLNIITYLPWKAWPSITSKINKEELINLLESTKRLSSPEALLWVWKNKSTLPKTLQEKINTINLFASFARKQTGAIWNTAVNELKKLIIQNKEFQLSLIEDKNDEYHIIDFLERLNNLTSFSKTEKQSIIVKLSRHFPAMKDLFNSGKAKEVLTAQKDTENESAPVEERHITSQKSYKEKLAELDDIINVQMPENTQAIATARAHGDLRENAEYAAAKERQKYLTEHRAMLEERILTTVPTDFSDIEIKDKIIAGCTVKLKYLDNKIDIYHILGAWDSDPAKKYVSYETGMGKVLIGKKEGESVTLPDGNICAIESIEPLSDKIRTELLG